MISKILIANRGEIACRVIATCQRLNLTSVAVYSEVDRYARHVQLADEAFYLGAAPAKDSYLNIERIVQVAQQSGCQAIHPGYGFLSENAEFAQRCADAGLVFIGPPPEAIAAMGSKSAAKNIMKKAGVPMLPSYHGADQSDEHLAQQADKIGYPLLIKAAYGGGGKGMRIVNQASELLEALASARREAQSAFANDELLLERYLTHTRHIEVQVFADQHGNVVYLSDRDCSIQRRHQKIIEEAPAPDLIDDLRWQMGETSVNAARAINYVGAGTVEYLLDEQDRFYFMEMNTRLQVEHPVTEMISGQDLVEWQIQVAQGQRLPLSQEQILSSGHAIEVRLYAEDPSRDFLPLTGQITQLRWPKQARIDTGVRQGDAITAYYDPMIAKLICHGASRSQALTNLRQALRHTQLDGLTTNLDFLQRILAHPAFAQGKLHTGFLNQHQATLVAPELTLWPAAWVAALQLLPVTKAGQVPSGWRLNAPAQIQLTLQDEQQTQVTIHLTRLGEHWRTEYQGQSYQLALQRYGQTLQFELDGHQQTWPFQQDENGITLYLPDGTKRFQLAQYSASSEPDSQHISDEQALTAPMNGTLIAHLVAVGDEVKAGQTLAVMEAMKMEYSIRAPFAGQVTALPFRSGDLVQEGVALAVVSPKEPHETQ